MFDHKTNNTRQEEYTSRHLKSSYFILSASIYTISLFPSNFRFAFMIIHSFSKSINCNFTGDALTKLPGRVPTPPHLAHTNKCKSHLAVHSICKLKTIWLTVFQSFWFRCCTSKASASFAIETRFMEFWETWTFQMNKILAWHGRMDTAQMEVGKTDVDDGLGKWLKTGGDGFWCDMKWFPFVIWNRTVFHDGCVSA